MTKDEAINILKRNKVCPKHGYRISSIYDITGDKDKCYACVVEEDLAKEREIQEAMKTLGLR